MTAVTYDNELDIAFEPHMKGPLVSSAVLHLVLIVIAIVGLPFIKPELPVIDDPISVELVEIDEITQTNKPQPEDVKRQPPEQAKEEPPKPVQPQVTSVTPPKPTPPVPPEKSEDIAPPQEKDPVAIAKPLPKPKTPPKPQERPVQAKPEEAQEEQFKSLLRNLMPAEEAPAQADKPRNGEQSSMLTRFSQQMTMSEMDAVKRQLTHCWSLMAGARYAEDLIVDIKIFVNPDRTIRDAKIENQMRYGTDNYFRAAADSALRAVYRCSPLDLPPDKYDLWQVITVRFDPREML